MMEYMKSVKRMNISVPKSTYTMKIVRCMNMNDDKVLFEETTGGIDEDLYERLMYENYNDKTNVSKGKGMYYDMMKDYN